MIELKNISKKYGNFPALKGLDLTVDAGEIFGFNTIEEYIKNPGMYSAPRQIRVGLSVGF